MLLVFGSINVDLVLRCASLPREGETLLAQHSVLAAGGKGANQAHAAALAGARVALFGAVGQDPLADVALRGLLAAGVDVNGVARVDALTGCASVALGANGANQIIVASGANALVYTDQISDVELHKHRMLLMQMELPFDQTLAMLQRAKGAGLQTVVNNAPAASLDVGALRLIDLLVVNEHEFFDTVQCLGATKPIEQDLTQAIAALAKLSGGSVIVTLGERGAIAWHEGALTEVSTRSVAVVDTTGAGDTFCGTLCAAMLNGEPLPRAMQTATEAASKACTWFGAQRPLTPPSPHRGEG